MFLDQRELTDKDHLLCDLCIVGGGAAGITIAKTFDRGNVKVILVESGDLDFEEDTQALYRGDVVGMPYPVDLDEARIRYFGGSTNHWGGTCWPMTAQDFEKRAGVPHSGWPITREALNPYYLEAQEVCDLGPYGYDERIWDGESMGVLPEFDNEKLEIAFPQYSPPTLFGLKYRAVLEKSKNVRVLLNANLTNLRLNDARNQIQKIHLKSLTGVSTTISAKKYILACGGIANARILLAARDDVPEGIGNKYDNVGRYFMDHVYLPAAEIVGKHKTRILDLFGPGRKHNKNLDIMVGASPVLPATAKEKNQVLGSSVYFIEESVPRSPGVQSMVRLRHALRNGRILPDTGEEVWSMISDIDEVAGFIYNRVRGIPESQWMDRRLSLRMRSEQAPNPDSRITLSDEKDALGIPKPRLDWQLSGIDKRTIRKMAFLVAEEFGRLDIARVKLDHWLLEVDAKWPSNFNGGAHHMGTTRMSDDPKSGVVDKNCKVFGVGNLFVAGSSVFTTGSFVNPTLTIVALALRLANHIKERV